jgi:hypothetical protein
MTAVGRFISQQFCYDLRTTEQSGYPFLQTLSPNACCISLSLAFPIKDLDTVIVFHFTQSSLCRELKMVTFINLPV